MADLVFWPAFVDVDSEREVVLEEIAMVEDTPTTSSTTSRPRRCSARIHSAGR